MDDVELAIAAVQVGASIIRDRYGTRLERVAKSASDFATDADFASEKAILRLLSDARPDDAIRGEELGASGPREASRAWLVDPLCGTLNFAANAPAFSVNAALTVSGQVQVAAVADPLAGMTYWTDGEMAWCRDSTGVRPLTPSADSRLVDVNLDTDDPDADGFSPSRFLRSGAFRALRPRVISTTLALTWVATGQRAGYVTGGDLRDSVHFASTIAICQSAGCIVSNLSGAPVHAGVGGLVAAADPETHAILLAAVDDQMHAEARRLRA